MSRQRELERLLELKYELDSAGAAQKAHWQQQFEQALSIVLQRTKSSRQEFLSALMIRYRDYRRQRLNAERLSGAQHLRVPPQWPPKKA